MGFKEPINPGLAFSLSVLKMDFYNQTVTSDSSTFLKIQTKPSANSSSGYTGPLLAALVSGEAIFQLMGGRATVSVGVQPYFAEIDAGSDLTLLAGEVLIFAEGSDDQSRTTLRYVAL
jgi:hypothetical protein